MQCMVAVYDWVAFSCKNHEMHVCMLHVHGMHVCMLHVHGMHVCIFAHSLLLSKLAVMQ